jgi:hypothetical protein
VNPNRKEREMNKMISGRIGRQIVAHYESKLPRKENYRRKTLAHLGKLHGRLLHYTGLLRNQLVKFPDDRTAQELLAMYEYHRQMALLAIAAKTGKAA